MRKSIAIVAFGLVLLFILTQARRTCSQPPVTIGGVFEVAGCGPHQPDERAIRAGRLRDGI